MAKNDASESAKPNPAAEKSAEARQDKKNDRAKKQRVELPPVVEMIISIARSTVLLFAIVVALVSLNAGADVQTIFIRIMVTLMGSGLVLWLATWWITQLYFENVIQKQNSQVGGAPEEGLIKDVKA
jgi:hypothetical protein